MATWHQKIKRQLGFFVLTCFLSVSIFSGAFATAGISKKVWILTPQSNAVYTQGQNLEIKVAGSTHVKIGLVKKEATDKQNISQNVVGWIAELENTDYIKKIDWNLWRTCDVNLQNCQMVPAGDYKIVAVTKDGLGAPAGKYAPVSFTDDNFDLSSGILTINKGELKAQLTLVSNPLPQFGSLFDNSSLLEANVGDEIAFYHQFEQNGVINNATVWNFDAMALQKTSDDPFKVKVLKEGESQVSVTMSPTMADNSTRIVNSNIITVRGLKAGTAKVYVLNESLNNGTLTFDYILSGQAASVCSILDEDMPASEYAALPASTSKRQVSCNSSKRSSVSFTNLLINKTYYLSVLPFAEGKVIGSGVFAKQIFSARPLANFEVSQEAWKTAIVAGYKDNADVAQKICLILESENSQTFYLTPPQETEKRKVACSNHNEYKYAFTNLQPNTKYYLSYYGYNKDANNNWVLFGVNPVSGRIEISTLLNELPNSKMLVQSDVVSYKGQISDFAPNTNIDDLAAKMNIQMVGTNPSEDYRFVIVTEVVSDSGKSKISSYDLDANTTQLSPFVTGTEGFANGTYEKLRLKNIKLYYVALRDIKRVGLFDTMICGKKIEEWGMNTASCAKGDALVDIKKLFAEHGYDTDKAYQGNDSTQTPTLTSQDGAAGQINDYYQVTDLGLNGRDLISLSDDAKYRPKNNPYLEFDYKMTMDSNLSLGLMTADNQIYFFVGNKAQAPRSLASAVVNYKQDNLWHHAKLNIYELIGKKDLEIKNIWIEDFDSENKKFTYSFANFSPFILSFNPTLKQGDQILTYVPVLNRFAASPITSYYEVTDAGASQNDLINLSSDAQYKVKDNPYLEFDYKIPANVKLSLGLLTPNNDIFFIAGKTSQSPRVTPRGVMNLVQDNAWHKVKINLYDILGKKPWEIKRMWFEDFETNEKYTFYFANFSPFIKNFEPKPGQGDQWVEKKLGAPAETPIVTLSSVGQIPVSSYPLDSDDRAFLGFELNSTKHIEVKKLQIKVEAVSAGADSAVDAEDLYNSVKQKNNLKDFRITELNPDNTRTNRMGPKELSYKAEADDLSQTITFSDTFALAPGETKKLLVTADIDREAISGDQYRVTLLPISVTDGIKDIDENKYVSDIKPNQEIKGNIITALKSSLEVSLSSVPTSQNFPRGKADVPLACFLFRSGDADDVILTDLTLTGLVENDDDSLTDWEVAADSDPNNGTAIFANIVKDIVLMDGNTQVGQIKIPNSNGKTVFTSLSWTIPKGTTKKLCAWGDLSTNVKVGGREDKVAVAIEKIADLAAQDSQGNMDKISLVAGGANIPLTKNLLGAYSSSPNAYVNVLDVGNLVFENPAAQVPDQVVISGQSAVKLAQFKVKASSEDFTIKKLPLTLNGRNDNRALTGLTLKYPTYLASPLNLNGSSTIVLPSSGGVVVFDNLSFAVPHTATDGVQFEIYGSFAPIDESGDSAKAKSGDSVSIGIYATSNSAYFQAVGNQSTALLSEIKNSLYANTAYLRKNMPILRYLGVNPGILVYSNESPVVTFKVLSEPSGNIDFSQIEFIVDHQGLETSSVNGLTMASGWKFYEYVNQGVSLAEATFDLTKGTVRFDLGANYQTVDGMGKTYVIKAPILPDTNPATTAGLAIKITKDIQPGITGTAAQIAAQGEDLNNFVWSDRTAPNHSLTTMDWTNGYALNFTDNPYILQ